MRIIDQLVYKITGDNTEFDKSIDGSEKKVDKFGSMADKIFAGITVAAIGMTIKKLAELATESAASLDRVDKLSQKIGISREAFQEWDFILTQSGASVEGLQTGIKTLSSFVDQAKNGNDEAIRTFDQLGVSIYDLNGNIKDQETLFKETFNALQNVENQTERTAIATRLLGRSATELSPALNTSAEDLEALRLQAHQLGLVMSDDAVNAGVRFSDNISAIKESITALKTDAMVPIINAVVFFTDKLLGQDTAQRNLKLATDALKTSSAEYGAVTKALTTDVDKLTTAEKAQLQARQAQLQLEIFNALKAQSKAYEELSGVREKNARADEAARLQMETYERSLVQQAKNLKMVGAETASVDELTTFLSNTVKQGSAEQRAFIRVMEGRAKLESDIATRVLETTVAEAERNAFIAETAALVAEGTVSLEAYKNIDKLLYEQIMAESDNMKRNMAVVAEQAAAGLEQGVEGIKEVGEASGEAYLEGVKTRMGIMSPSREMRFIGQFIMEGLRLGLKDGEETVSSQYKAFLDGLEQDSKDTANLIKGAISSSFTVFTDLAQVIKDGGSAWDVFAAAGLGAIASVIEGLGQMLAVKAAEAYVLALFGDVTKIGAGVAASAGAITAYTAAGLVRAQIPSYDVGSINIPRTQQATVHQGEMILPAPIAAEARQSGINIAPTNAVGGSTVLMVYLDGKKIAESTVGHINSGGVNRIDARVVK